MLDDHPRDPGPRRLTIYTIGLGGRQLAEIEGILDRHGISTLVDVRTEAEPGEPDTSTLAEQCRVIGLGYLWMGDRLGGRPRHPSLLSADGLPDWDAVARSPMFRAAIGELMTLAETGHVAVLCSEESPEVCHRSFLIGTHLEDTGVEVLHIRGDALFRHQRGLGL